MLSNESLLIESWLRWIEIYAVIFVHPLACSRKYWLPPRRCIICHFYFWLRTTYPVHEHATSAFSFVPYLTSIEKLGNTKNIRLGLLLRMTNFCFVWNVCSSLILLSKSNTKQKKERRWHVRVLSMSCGARKRKRRQKKTDNAICWGKKALPRTRNETPRL